MLNLVGHFRGLKGKPHYFQTIRPSQKHSLIKWTKTNTKIQHSDLIFPKKSYRFFSQSLLFRRDSNDEELEDEEEGEEGENQPKLLSEEEYIAKKKQEREDELEHLMEKASDVPPITVNVTPSLTPRDHIEQTEEIVETVVILKETEREKEEVPPEILQFGRKMEEYQEGRILWQTFIQNKMDEIEKERPKSIEAISQEHINAQREIEDNRLKNSYVKQYENYLNMVDEHNRKVDEFIYSKDVLQGLAGFRAWLLLRRDDKTKENLARLTRREIRGLWRDTQMAIGGTTLHSISYHLTFPILDLQKNIEENRRKLLGAAMASRKTLKKERQLMGTLIPLKIAQVVAVKVTDDIVSNFRFSGLLGRKRQKAWFHRPTGRYGPGPSIYQDKIADIAEGNIPEDPILIPGSASTTTLTFPKDTVRESIVQEPVIRDISKLAFEEVVNPKQIVPPKAPKGWESKKNKPKNYLARWLNWRHPWKPYRSYEEGLAEYIELDPVLKEQREKENEERRAKWGGQVDPLAHFGQKELNDWMLFQELKPFTFPVEDVTVPPRSDLYPDPGGSFGEMTPQEKKDYLLSNISNKWLWAGWKRKRRNSKRFWPHLQNNLKRLIPFRRRQKFKGTMKRRRYTKKMRYINPHWVRYRRLCWSTIRKELDPNWRKKGFKLLLRRHYMPLFFTSMSGNFAKMWAMKAICGPSLYTRMTRMKDLLIEHDASSYFKYYKIKRMKIGRHVKQINGTIWIYVNCDVFCDHWIKDKYGRLMTGAPGRILRQGWQFAFYRDDGDMNAGEHHTAVKGMWKIGAARRRRLRGLRKLQPQVDRQEWMNILKEQGIDYDDVATDGVDVLYNNQEFLEFVHERRPTPDQEASFGKTIAEMIKNDANILEIDQKQMKEELDEIKKSRPEKTLNSDEEFLNKVWDIEDSYVPMTEAATMADFLESKKRAANPISSFIQMKKEQEQDELRTKIHQRIWEDWEEDYESEKKASVSKSQSPKK
eukprot:TRINITY_DN789_c0_g1_i2.p1 TRINITY_DN789_c0_g1~~TRINITY_DN789_c0_g1_i2.p1  ORF type:complete len:1027 (+),score=313.58 TRINITY_DN789_c0_g1_i2:114-3083(+)